MNKVTTTVITTSYIATRYAATSYGTTRYETTTFSVNYTTSFLRHVMVHKDPILKQNLVT